MGDSQIQIDNVEQARYTRRQPTTQSGGFYTPANPKMTFKIPGNGLMWDCNRSYISAKVQVFPTQQTYGPSQPWTYSLNYGLFGATPYAITAAFQAFTTYTVSIGGIASQEILVTDTIAQIMAKLQAHPIVRKYSQNGDGWPVVSAGQGTLTGTAVGLGGVPLGAYGPSISITSAGTPTDVLGGTGGSTATDSIEISYTGYLYGVNVELLNLHPVVTTITSLTASQSSAVIISRLYPSANSYMLGGVNTPISQISQVAGPSNGQYPNSTPLYLGGTNNVFNPGAPTNPAGVAAPTGYTGTGLCDTAALPVNIGNIFNRVTFRIGSTPICDEYNYNLIQSINQVMHQNEEYLPALGEITQNFGPQGSQIDGIDRTTKSMSGHTYAIKMQLGPMRTTMFPLDPLGNTNVEVDLYLEQAANVLEITQYGLASTTANAASGNIPTTYNCRDTSSLWSYSVSDVVWVLEYVKYFEDKRRAYLQSLPMSIPFRMSLVQQTSIPAGTQTLNYNVLTRVSNLNKLTFLIQPTQTSGSLFWADRFQNFVRANLSNFYIRVDTQNYSDPIPATGEGPESYIELQKLFMGSPQEAAQFTTINRSRYPQSPLDEYNHWNGVSAPYLPSAHAPSSSSVNQTVAHTRLNYYPLKLYKEDGNNFYFGVRMQRSPYHMNMLSGVNTAVTSATIILLAQFSVPTEINMNLYTLQEYDVVMQIANNSVSVNQ